MTDFKRVTYYYLGCCCLVCCGVIYKLDCRIRNYLCCWSLESKSSLYDNHPCTVHSSLNLNVVEMLFVLSWRYPMFEFHGNDALRMPLEWLDCSNCLSFCHQMHILSFAHQWKKHWQRWQLSLPYHRYQLVLSCSLIILIGALSIELLSGWWNPG